MKQTILTVLLLAQLFNVAMATQIIGSGTNQNGETEPLCKFNDGSIGFCSLPQETYYQPSQQSYYRTTQTTTPGVQPISQVTAATIQNTRNNFNSAFSLVYEVANGVSTIRNMTRYMW